ncbi:MAG: FAD-dependent oxidoreductase [Phycisphaeraceae bacterium]
MSDYSFQRAIPCDESFDVIVVGGGPAGCTAAAAAARQGARTLMIEASGCLGGSGTSALVPAWCPFSDKEQIIYRGLAQRVLEQSKQGSPHIKPDALDWVPIDPEKLKRIYDDLVTEFGVKVLFHTMLSHVDAQARPCETSSLAGIRSVNAIVTTNKAGLQAWRAKVYIDCTGDADLCAWAGAKFAKGDDRGGKLMPATHCFMLSNVDEYGYRFGPKLHSAHADSPMHAILGSGKYPRISDAHCCNNMVGPGTVGFNAGHVWGVDNTEPWSVSAALIEGRKMAAAFRDALAEFHPQAFGNAFLVTTGAQIGIRETRRVIGDYVLTLDDYLQRRSFNDEICRNSYFIDVHRGKEEAAKSHDDYKKWEKMTHRYEKGESHGIPYRCLTPRDLRNVLVAGRSVSAERIVQGSIRVMPVCLAMGEAAGMAAALAGASEQHDVHTVDVQDLRDRLRKVGAYLP